FQCLPPAGHTTTAVPAERRAGPLPLAVAGRPSGEYPDQKANRSGPQLPIVHWVWDSTPPLDAPGGQNRSGPLSPSLHLARADGDRGPTPAPFEPTGEQASPNSLCPAHHTPAPRAS